MLNQSQLQHKKSRILELTKIRDASHVFWNPLELDQEIAYQWL